MREFLNIQETINKYLEYRVNRKSEEDGTYRPKIVSFLNYLIEERDIENRIFKLYLNQ